MTTVTISLPETLKAFIDEQLVTKGCGNVGEYFPISAPRGTGSVAIPDATSGMPV